MDNILPAVVPEADIDVGELLRPANKDDITSMEYPVFSIRKGGDREVRRYERGNYFIEVIPSVLGSATIWDKDILLYLWSLLREKLDRGLAVLPERVSVNAADLLHSIDRGGGGKDYKELAKGLARLKGTSVRTNVPTGLEKRNEFTDTSEFSLLPDFHLMRDRSTRRLTRLILEPSPWFFRQVVAGDVLTIDPRYFQLTKALHRRLYEIARKHCGSQSRWKIALTGLQAKVGAAGPHWRFRSALRAAMSEGSTVKILDYTFALDDRGLVHVSRGTGP